MPAAPASLERGKFGSRPTANSMEEDRLQPAGTNIQEDPSSWGTKSEAERPGVSGSTSSDSSPPRESFRNTLSYWSAQRLTAPPPSGHSWTKLGKIIATLAVHFYVLNSESFNWISSNFYKMYRNNYRLTCCYRNCDVVIPFGKLVRRIKIVKLRPSHCKNSTLYPLELRSYWTEIHQLFTPCRGIIALLMCIFTTRYCIPFRNDRAKSEGGQFQRLRMAPKISCLP